MAEFSGKVALVTGASSGIGRMSALYYARDGAKVIISDLNEEGGQETVKLIQKANGEAFFIKSNVAKPEDCEALVQKTLEKYGRLDIACNNAGIGGESNLTVGYSIEGWKKVIDINLSGVFYCMKYEIPAMLKTGGGAIVNLASILGQVGFGGAVAYTAAKHGVVGLTQVAALENSPQGIRINAVGPGFIKTPMIADIDEAMLVPLHPIGRLGKPEEVAELIIWLSSDKASFITGAYYPVDGGYLAR